MMAGSGREIPKGKLSLIVTAHHPVKETNPTTFLDFHLTFSEALNQNFNARKVKKRKFALGIEKRALLPVKLETFPSRFNTFIKNFLDRLRTRFSEECAHLLEAADVRTFLTLVNEYFNSELRQVIDTPTVLDRAINFEEAADETLKRIGWPGYICFTREKQH